MKFTCFPKPSENEKAEKERKQSAERIQSLHTRLHQEAEKIRKWKTSTEIEMKEKVITSDVIKSYDSCLVYENKAVGVKVIKNQKDKHILRMFLCIHRKIEVNDHSFISNFSTRTICLRN